MNISYFLKIIRKEKKTFFSSLILRLLFGISLIYRLIVFFRNVLYDKRLIKTYTFDGKVISVGNLVAGGTGKTPITLKLAKAFEKKTPLAILSRGYQSQIEREQGILVLSKGKGPIVGPDICGDEPFLISRNIPTALFLVGKDRQITAKKAQKMGAKYLLLDDGMQHRRLQRDYELVVMDAQDLFGQKFFLPRGFLREHPKALSRAHLICINHVYNLFQIPALKREIAKYSTSPIVCMVPKPHTLLNRQDQIVNLEKNTKVAIFCGIAKPEYFKKGIEGLNLEVVATNFLSDHASISKKEIDALALLAKSKGATYLICTEKDIVKLSNIITNVLPILYLKIEMQIIDGLAHWDTFIEKVRTSSIKHSF